MTPAGHAPEELEADLVLSVGLYRGTRLRPPPEDRAVPLDNPRPKSDKRSCAVGATREWLPGSGTWWRAAMTVPATPGAAGARRQLTKFKDRLRVPPVLRPSDSAHGAEGEEG